MYNCIYARLGVAAAANSLDLNSFLKGLRCPKLCPTAFPLCSLALPLGGFPCARACFAFGWNSLAFGRLCLPLWVPFFRDLRLAVLPISLFLLRFAWL